MNRADSRIYPQKEMMAIDMAELMRAALIEDGIIQGCQFHLDGGHLLMTPGRIVIGGRLGVFEADQGESYIDIALPDHTQLTSDAQRFICALYDPRGTNRNKLYIELLNQTDLTGTNGLDNNDMFKPSNSRYDFNAMNYGRYLKLGFVKVRASTGEAYDLDTSVSTYPDSAEKSNENYVKTEITKFKQREDNRLAYLKAADQYNTNVRHRSAWFKNDTVVIDGISVAAGKTTTIRVRKEIGGKVYVRPASGTAPTIPTNPTFPYTYINHDGGNPISSSPGPNPRATKQETTYFPGTTQETKVITNTNEVDLNRGIVGVKITNATASGSGATNCVVQSYWVDEPTASGSIPASINWQGFMNVVVRNVGSSAAKIKVEITSLYVRNADFNYPRD